MPTGVPPKPPRRCSATTAWRPGARPVSPRSAPCPPACCARNSSVRGPVNRATAYISGLGLSELYLNGAKVGDHVLSPASPSTTSACSTSPTTSRDNSPPAATPSASCSATAATARRVQRVPIGMPQLRLSQSSASSSNIEYADGTKPTIVSDETWKLTTDGPIRANNEYDGEEYDARMEMPGWSRAGFDDSQVGAGRSSSTRPTGALAAQMIEPIRVVETLKPVTITEPRPGVYDLRHGPEHGRLVPPAGRRPDGHRRSRCATPKRSRPTARSTSTTSARRTRHESLHAQGRRRRSLGAALHLSRLPLRRGDAASPASPRSTRSKAAWCTTTCADRRHFAAPTRCSTASTTTSSGACAATTAASPPTARSATSARAGSATAPASRSETYLFDIAAFYAKWLHGHRRRAAPHRQRPGRLARLLAALQRQRHLAQHASSSCPACSTTSTATCASSRATTRR